MKTTNAHSKPQETRHTWKKIGTFVLITFGLSAIFDALIVSQGSMLAGGMVYLVALMWCPGIAAILTRLIYQHNLRGFGWGWGQTRYQVLSYILPILYAGIAYGIVWSTGLAKFYDPDFVAMVMDRLGTATLSPGAVLALKFGLEATVGVLLTSVAVLGEELGWRGFLVPELAKVTSFTGTALLSGAIWVCYHLPVMLLADYNGGTPAWYGLTCFTVMVLGLNVAYTWLRLRSGSLWTGLLLHAVHNQVIQRFFDPATADTGYTAYIIGEFGIALAIAGLVVGLVFWLNRASLADKNVQNTRVEVVSRRVVSRV